MIVAPYDALNAMGVMGKATEFKAIAVQQMMIKRRSLKGHS
ncbi:MAG: hypothetical protein RBJ76_19955 [Stenomitos frigidus ULC029]